VKKDMPVTLMYIEMQFFPQRLSGNRYISKYFAVILLATMLGQIKNTWLASHSRNFSESGGDADQVFIFIWPYDKNYFILSFVQCIVHEIFTFH
jgi:hypothetical protein